MDLLFFDDGSTGKSKTHLCYSFECPERVKYGSIAANEYLAGEQRFHVKELIIQVFKGD